MERMRLVVAATITPEVIAHLRGALAGASGMLTLEGEAGAGVFCRGLDLGWASAQSAIPESLFRDFAALLEELAAVPGPTVALLDGVVSGGGVAIAAAADLVVATPRSTFALPEVLAGLVPAVALPWVARRTGWPRARLLALGGRAIDAAQAAALGLCDVVAEDLEAALDTHARRWRRADPAALAAVKRVGTDLEAALVRQMELLSSEGTKRRLARLAAGDPPWEED